MIARLTVVVLALLVFLIPLHPPEHARLLGAMWDFAHVPVFFVITAVFMGQRRDGNLVVPMLVLGCALLEVLQHYVGREGSMVDFGYGCAGIVLWWLPCRTGGGERGSRLFAAGLFVVFFILAVMPMLLVLRDQRAIKKEFPLLASFESFMEGGRWVLQGCTLSRVPHVTPEGNHAAQIIWDETADVEYPGLFLTEMCMDWSQVEALAFDIYSDSTDLDKLYFRLDDKAGNPSYSDRFQMCISLTPGWNHVEIPLKQMMYTPSGRVVDFAHVDKLGLFSEQTDTNMSFVLDNVRVKLR